jgi:ligand-binding SRPBCC domain-containing protein
MYHLRYEQHLPISLEESWEFFSNPKNLAFLTPPYLQFNIKETERMYAGQLIRYLIRPLFNIPMEWVTEITHVQEPVYFIDEQRFGPYKYWHHEHHFFATEKGVKMTDLIYYKMPFGLFGKALHALKVENDLKNVFSYRKDVLEKKFGV